MEAIGYRNLDRTTCRSCMACKIKGKASNVCKFKDALTPVFTVFAANVKKSLEVSKDLQADAIGRLTQAFMDRLEESTQSTFQDLSRSAVEGARMQKESAEAVKALVDGFSGTLSEMREISQAQKAILDDDELMFRTICQQFYGFFKHIGSLSFPYTQELGHHLVGRLRCPTLLFGSLITP